MSTDLEFQGSLTKIRLPATKITSSQSSDITDDNSGLIPVRNDSIGDEEECQTPKSPRHMIPKILSCPPAPMKPRPVASCKRKPCETLQFFEIVASEEVESFFRSSFGLINDINSCGSMKKRSG
ncbi:unnamed protein product [Ilex paraguariensis]|uniref:Cyclin-dependent protein kinase inhibitor SMR1 n=1 Tax=Ilex paraguariensis TaxID=185542 RepID=A0ABC8SQZ5_9AQUA